MVGEFPETRDSLLLQVQDPQNREAWDRFVAVYQPVIFRIALARGMQHADALDLVQQVLISVAGSVERWERKQTTSKFSHWLSRVTKNAIINALTRKPHDQASGGSTARLQLKELASTDEATGCLVDQELRRELYLRSAEIVKADFRRDTWDAFQYTVVDGQTPEEAAQALGKSVGAIYTARSRVMFRLKEVVRQLQEQMS